jgi:hypothetical protein
MIESLSILLAGAIWTLVALLFVDRHIKALIEEAFRLRCGNCEFKKSKIPESQKTPGVSEF